MSTFIGTDAYKNIIAGLKKALKEGKTPAFSYDRVSTVEQMAGMSLTYQSEGAARYAEEKDLCVVYYFTIAESASKEGRRVFNTMIDIALKYNVRHLIFKSTDRMSRNYRDLARIMELVDAHGFTMHFYQTNKMVQKGSTHDEKFIIGIEQAVAKHLSDKISHDITSVNSYKVKKGIFIGHAPFGYKYDKENKRFIIDKNKEFIARYIFNEFDGGDYSLAKFCVLLNGLGYCSPKGSIWSKSILGAHSKEPL